jgi:hypothetical protein
MRGTYQMEHHLHETGPCLNFNDVLIKEFITITYSTNYGKQGAGQVHI